MLTVAEKKYMRSMLPYGSGLKIAKKAAVSPQSVSYYFKGYFNSERIEDAAIDVFDQVRKADKRKKAKLSK